MIDDDELQTLLEEIGAVSSVYHRPAESFITPKVGPKPIDDVGEEAAVDLEESEEEEEEEEDSDIFAEEEGEASDKEANFIFLIVCCRNCVGDAAEISLVTLQRQK